MVGLQVSMDHVTQEHFNFRWAISMVSSGKRLHSYWSHGPVEIVDLPMNSMAIFHSYVNVYQRVIAVPAFQKATWLRLGVAVQVTVPSVMSFTDIESPIGTFEASVCDALETWWERWSPWENLLNFKIWMIFDDFWCLESFHLDRKLDHLDDHFMLAHFLAGIR